MTSWVIIYQDRLCRNVNIQLVKQSNLSNENFKNETIRWNNLDRNTTFDLYMIKYLECWELPIHVLYLVSDQKLNSIARLYAEHETKMHALYPYSDWWANLSHDVFYSIWKNISLIPKFELNCISSSNFRGSRSHSLYMTSNH